MGRRWPCAECRRTASGESGGRDPVSACGPRTGRVPPRAPVAQWIERLPPEQKAAGSNPVRGTAPAPPPPPTAGRHRPGGAAARQARRRGTRRFESSPPRSITPGPPPARAARDAEQLTAITTAHSKNPGVHGTGKIHAPPNRKPQDRAARRTVERLTRAADLHGTARKKTRRTTTTASTANSSRPHPLNTRPRTRQPRPTSTTITTRSSQKTRTNQTPTKLRAIHDVVVSRRAFGMRA